LLGIGWEVDGGEEIAKAFEDVASLEDGEGAESEERKVEYPAVMAVGLAGGKAGFDEIEKRQCKQEQCDGPGAESCAEAVG
jgi:hypothetical protein